MPESSNTHIPRWLPFLLGALQAVGPVSVDMYLPAFPSLEHDLHAAAGGAQITLSTWILGLAVGQLVMGALADRFGRRTPLLAGLVVNVAATAACALAPSIAWLAAWRFIAALGASASMIVPRAIVRDLADGHDAARLMAQLILILGAAPILAPSLGGLVLQFGGWRDIFWIMTTFSGFGLALAAPFLPDTLPASRRRPLHPVAMLGRYRTILTERGFLTHAMIVAGVGFALFAYLGGMPALFMEHFHLSPGQFAIVFGMVAASYILGTQLNVHLTRVLGLSRSLHVTTACYLALTAALVGVAIVPGNWPWVMGGLLMMGQGLIGFIAPTAMVGALSGHSDHAGSASAVLGTLQFAIGSTAGFLLASMNGGSAIPMVALMLFGALGMKLADLCRPASVKAPSSHSCDNFRELVHAPHPPAGRAP